MEKKAESELGLVLSALSDPNRRRVIAALAHAPAGTERTCVSFGLPVTKATLTHHFKILRQAGLIDQIDRGHSRAAFLRREYIDEKFPGLLNIILSEYPEYK